MLVDELLCEFVDGTIEESIRDDFEACMRANRDLAVRVDRLRATRQLLRQYRWRDTNGTNQRVRARLLRQLQASGAPKASGSMFRVLALALCAMPLVQTAPMVPVPALHQALALPAAMPYWAQSCPSGAGALRIAASPHLMTATAVSCK